MWRAFAFAMVAAGASMLVVAPAPSYDPWMWLLWGREVAGGGLDTRDGPAFKPLTVAICALLAPLGPAAPVAWVLLVRTAAVLAAWLAWSLGRALSGGSRLGGALAVVAVVLCGRFVDHTAAGAEPALVLLAALAGVKAWRAGRVGLAAGCAIACGLLRVEAWPFLLAGGLFLWRRERRQAEEGAASAALPPGGASRRRAALIAAAVLVGAAWFLPEWLASGDPLRSGSRARVPNAGQPALADVPALASLGDALALPPWPLWIGAALLVARRSRGALALVAAGLAWILVVAGMAEAGFSGEARYALPGAALVGIGGAAGIGLAARSAGSRRAFAVAAALLVILPAADRVGRLDDLRAAQARQAELAARLADAVAASGGRGAVLRCGQPYVGPLRGPLLAYRLRVRKAHVEPDAPPRAPGVAFISRLTAGAERLPAVPPGFAATARAGPWLVRSACRASAGAPGSPAASAIRVP